MGTIAQIFESGQQSSQKGHFRNLVMLARIDGKLDESENSLLMRVAARLSITNEQMKEILDDANAYPMIPPTTREERYERFIQLVQMMLLDGKIDKSEDHLVHRFAISLGFTEERFLEKYPQIVELVQKGMDRDEILESIMKK
ncbi:MAG: putative tellurite resistance protein B-like protein [Psychromonas sp.]|jgi:uncharacterized tellurite resistance protein B-like protein